MAEIAPLTPLRYAPTRLASVVAPPYDVIGAEERAELMARDPYNVVRLILPDGEGDAKYAHAADLLAAWRKEGILVRDDEPAFYRYDQTFSAPGLKDARRIRRRGFLALVRLVSLSERVVLPHERTLSGPKEDRLKLFRATQTNLSPGFMLYRDPSRSLDAPLETARVLAEWKTPDGVEHVLAKVTDRDAIRAIVAGVAHVPGTAPSAPGATLLIADGHHRYETALRYSGEVAEASRAAGPRAASRYFMTFLANGDDPNLLIFPTHRHVHGLSSFSFESLVDRARQTFRVERLPDGADVATMTAALAGAETPSVVCASREGKSAVLALRPEMDLATHPTLGRAHETLRHTDVAVLHLGILEHLLGITPAAQAAKTNLWYPQDAAASLVDLRAGKGDVLFIMNPTPVEQVRRVAEAGEVMPQKSTFFYPKVLTGLAIHTLEPDRTVAEAPSYAPSYA
jgi:uncharacterized protein (DUF1015 family)